MAPVSGLIVDKSGVLYNFMQDGNETLISVRVSEDKSWNSSAYRKFFHKGSKGQDLDLNQIWHEDPNFSNRTKIKKINLENHFNEDPLKYFETYYPSQPKTEKLLVLGFVTRNGKKTYFSRTELKLNEDGDLNFNSLKQIQGKEFFNELYKENYSQNKVLTVKIDTKESYHNVEIKTEKVNGTEEFYKYIHTPSSNASDYTNLVLDCNSKCEFKGFVTSEYSNVKLQEVCVYFRESDSNHRVPLLIELKPKNGQQFSGKDSNKSVYYELKSINKNKAEENPRKWTKNYQTLESLTQEVSTILNGIYHGTFTDDIEKLINYSEDNSTVIGAVSGTVGTIGAIGTGVGGFFIYKNSALVVTFLKSLF